MGDWSIRNVVVPLLVVPYLATLSQGLKCRTYQEVHENNDLEYVVRMCLRHMNNETDFIDQFYRNQEESNSNRDKNNYNRDDYNPYRNNQNNYNGNYYSGNRQNDFNGYNNYNDNNNNNNNNRNKGNSDRGNNRNRNQDKSYSLGFDGFWPSGNKQQRPSDGNNGYWDEDEGKREGDYGDESDYYNPQRNRKEERQKHKSRPSLPHSYQQQMQHDRETMQDQGSRKSTNYFFSNRKQSTNLSHLDRDSPLADIEPCVIHCIFQEMKMVDNNGKPNKELISQKMTQKIRNPDLKNFIRESVEECYESIDSNDFAYSHGGGRNQQRSQGEMCEWAKTFAICLENRGKENCDDWNDPTQKSKQSNNNNDNSNSNNNNNNNYNNKTNSMRKNNGSNNNKNNEGSKSKTK